jgi:Tfp pilus assembly protein PilF
LREICGAVQTEDMTEAEFIARLTPHLPKGCSASDEALTLVTEAVRAFPESAALWLLHGQVTFCALDNDVSDTAVRSFEMAIALDPRLADAHEALGHYYDGMKDKPEKAMAYHAKATEIRRAPRA